MDAVADPEVEQVVVMSSAQVGKTELLLNLLGYYVHFDPSPMLLLQPTVDMAMAFSKDRLAPMIRDTPALSGRIADAKSKTSGNTVLHKTFAGGHITMAGANSPASLASRPIRVLLADEIDRYPPTAGTEGDPFSLAKKRTTTFHNRKIVAVSTPTVKGASRIETLYDDSTMEQYCLPCPACGLKQPLKWSNIVFDQVGHACEHCGVISGQLDWTVQEGEWVARNPDHKTRGFHLNELVSPWRKWENVIEDFIQAKKSPETLKTFVNTSLGETWEEDGVTLEGSELHKRREHYKDDVPDGCLLLTAAVDVQDDRLEVGVEGWGKGEENWKIDYRIIRGDPSKPELWKKLDETLQMKYETSHGTMLPIACTTIDSGGHYTQEVYKFVKHREARRIFAIKGMAGQGVPVVKRPSKGNLGKVNLFTIGVDTAKESIYARLRNLDVGAGYVHFPVRDLYDEEYFQQLTAEKCVTKYLKGHPKREWVKTRVRNEALDVAVYNLAALYILNPNFDKIAERLIEEPAEIEPEEEMPEEPPKTAPRRSAVARRPKQRGFTNSWR